MSRYAILNFEDKIGSEGKGAADSTIMALKYRYEQKRAPRGLKKIFVKGNVVEEYRCVKKNPVAFTTDPGALLSIKEACAKATKIYAILHGDPRTTDTAYTNAQVGVGVQQLCTAQQLAAFLTKVLPAKGDFTLALVMCYGARCRNYKSANVYHQGSMPIEDLKTSFAYRLVYYLKEAGYAPTVTAVTGKIQHDHTSGRALIEREELIDVNMELAETSRKFTQDAKPHGGGQEFKKTTGGQAQFAQINALQAQRTAIRKDLPAGDESNKYGKLVYRVRNGILTIVNKYGADGDNAVGPQTVLYSGAPVPP